MQNNHYSLAACLPLIELTTEAPLLMGPVLFWPAFQFNLFGGPPSAHLPSSNILCISLCDEIPAAQKKQLLIDAIYLLYFASIFKEIYQNSLTVPFNPFTKLLYLEELQQVDWQKARKNEEKIEKIHWINPEVCQGMGCILEQLYLPQEKLNFSLSPSNLTEIKRIVRAVRFFVDQYYIKFNSKSYPNKISFSKPEEIIFLSTSFETLLDLTPIMPSADFKQKLRPLLDLKFSRPIEIFWKWVDGFFSLKEKMIHHGDILDGTFRENENFVFPYSFWSIKLFIYTAHYQLYKIHLLFTDKEKGPSPSHFNWLSPEELLIFLWPEKVILKKLILLLQREFPHPSQDVQKELFLLAHLFQIIHERYYENDLDKKEGIQFIKTPKEEIHSSIESLLLLIKQNEKASSYFPPHFFELLHNRLTA